MPIDDEAKIRKTMFNDANAVITNEPLTSDDEPQPPNATVRIDTVVAWVSILLIVAGTTALTIGVTMALGIPAGLVILGIIVLGLGIMLGLVT